MNMKMRSHVKVFVFMMVCIFGSAQSGGTSSLEQYLNYDSSASNETIQIAAGQGTESFSYDKKESGKTCWMNTGKAHKYLGYGTLLMAAAAGVSGGDNGFHKGAGIGAAVLGVAACGTGFYEYGNYFDLDEGFSKHNMHIVLGTLATAGFVLVAASAISDDDDSHAGLGIGSTALMVIPIIVLKF
jgi:hypothetical protein